MSENSPKQKSGNSFSSLKAFFFQQKVKAVALASPLTGGIKANARKATVIQVSGAKCSCS